MSAPRITVVGSLNIDRTYSVERLPTPGQTVRSRKATMSFGGKGANQAVAAARAGAQVSLIGAVGGDEIGVQYVARLEAEGIGLEGLLTADDHVTGSAAIVVEESGENSIVVDPGANGSLTVAHVESQSEVIKTSDVVLLQLECPLSCVRRAAEIARSADVPVFFNPSPLSPELLAAPIPCDTLIVNEGEAHEMGAAYPARQLVVTRGARSTTLYTKGEPPAELAPPSVLPVDTVGAGDAFAGYLVVACAEGMAPLEAIELANRAGATATLLAGAQDAIPKRGQLAFG